ncbi:MAG: N-acetylmuramoyl-L-alanine amidase [Oscillospiraceae bacterium]
MSSPDSALVMKFIAAYAGNYTKGRYRYGKITGITLHHMAANMLIEALGRLWQTVGRYGSSHYGVQLKNIAQYVNEADIAWTNGNWAANCTNVTIEVANSGGSPNWEIADDTIETLIQLVADIAERNDLYPLVVGTSLNWHSMYAATLCPGPYMMSMLSHIAQKANQIIFDKSKKPETTPTPARLGLYEYIITLLQAFEKPVFV